MANPFALTPGEAEYASFAGAVVIRRYLEEKKVQGTVTWFELEEMLEHIWIEAWLAAKVDGGLVHAP